MNRDDFSPSQGQHLVRSAEGHWAYVPPGLPPHLEPSWELLGIVSTAERGLSELVGIARTLPNPHLLIGSFIRQEAVLSSKIEGTQASLSDLVLFEAGGQLGSLPADAQEVVNYVSALKYGLVRKNEIPVCLRLIREIHSELMRGVRGQNLAPGSFRRSQVFIGASGAKVDEASYVPPPPGPALEQCMTELEHYFHTPSPLPDLVRLALVHYQFEAIHPFMDGNGRIGRLLIALLLCDWGLLSQPLLYLSAYFQKNRQEYYRLLLDVSQSGAWNEWVAFFLRGVAEQSQDAVRRANEMQELWRGYRDQLQASGASGRALQLLDTMFARPVVTIPQVEKELDLTYRGAQMVVAKLVDQGILEEVPELYRGRTKMFWSRRVLEIMMDSPVLEDDEEDEPGGGSDGARVAGTRDVGAVGALED